MNHCVLEVDVLQAPTLRYTQDNQTPIAEMDVGFDSLRSVLAVAFKAAAEFMLPEVAVFWKRQ